MRVALVSRELAPFYGGGIGTYVSEMSAVLAAAGHEVHVLTGPHEDVLSRGPALRPGVRFHCVEMESGRAALDAYPTFPMRYSMAVYEALERLAADGPFDYIEFPDYHAEGYFALRAKRTLGRFGRTVMAVRLHSPAWLCRGADGDARLTLELAHIEHMERSAVAEADVVIAPGRRVLERVVGGMEGSNSHRPRHEIVPLPVDHARLLRELGAGEIADRAETRSADPTPEVLFFGKLQHLKGPQDVVAAALILLGRGAPARFRLIGNDSPTSPFGKSMLAHLQARIPAGFRDRFTFEPARPRDQLAAAIRAATVVCLPSRWEAFPMVCLEALALGAPVVASDAGGLSEIIEHRASGLLFPAGDPEALASALDTLLGDAALRARLGEAGPARVRALCNPSAVLRQLEAVVHTNASQPSPQPATPRPTPSRPAVSILIPYYNLGPYLPETLASVRRQTVIDYEIILIDDGSTDPQSIDLLATLPPDIRIIRKPNGGLSSARNAGLATARGRWVLPLDADDLIEPTLLESALSAAAADPGLSYISPLVAYFTADPASPTGGWVPLGPDRDLLVAQNIGGAASGTLIDREAALAVGGYDTSLPSYEDWDFWCRLAESGRRGTVIPEFLLRYRVRGDSMYRTVALERHAALHSYIIAAHPRLPADPTRSTRILASLAASDPAATARALINENLRYRVVDRMNAALKRTGLQTPLKAAAITVLRAGRRARGS